MSRRTQHSILRTSAQRTVKAKYVAHILQHYQPPTEPCTSTCFQVAENGYKSQNTHLLSLTKDVPFLPQSPTALDSSPRLSYRYTHIILVVSHSSVSLKQAAVTPKRTSKAKNISLVLPHPAQHE